MNPLSQSSRLAAQVLAGGALIAVFLAGSPSQAPADELPTELQAADPSSGILLAAEPASKKEDKNPAEKDKHPKPCDEEPGTCNSMNVSSPDPTGCTSGSKCTFENKVCDLSGHHCRTVGSPGQCFCSCN